MSVWASAERDHTIAPAILELAETLAIARSLRFAGYGVEFCSAEEISNMENGNGNIRQPVQGSAETTKAEPKGGETSESGNGGNGGNGDKASGGNPNGGDNPNGHGNCRLSSKQYKYIMRLSNEQGMTRKELNARCIEDFGVLALLLASLARKVAFNAGVSLTLPALLKELSAIREVAVIYPPRTLAHPKDHITLSRMSGRQKKLAKALEIGETLSQKGQYTPKRYNCLNF